MFFLLIKSSQAWLDAHGLGFLRVFTFVTFQATVAVLMSFLICILLGPWVIEWLRRNKLGDLAKFDQAEMDKKMAGKNGTPTMGGILIIASILITTLLLADLRNFYVQMGMVALLGLGTIGAIDDWLKLTAGRRAGSRQGLEGPEKLIGQIGLAAILSYFTFRHGAANPVAHELYLPFIKTPVMTLGLGSFLLLGIVTITGFSNAVNLSDGLDGLAGGCMAIVSFVFLILALLGGIPELGRFLLLPTVPMSNQMAVMAGAMMGACLGFLWFNCNPAKVFMGDTGSLALGGLIAYISIVIRHEFTLVLVGGVFVAEAVSVVIQRYYFKYTRLRYGEGVRFFLMAPIHHHFQKKGWTETQVVVRFWLINAMLAAMAIATVKLR
ncbi:MAG: phospho-N-acetylmuramoyl-pentapeptide-transferase [Phycisphaerales bacterium]|jgi:phospho-N-acetylmuramoyl-pentapeptide-transferase|nr:phospho-N-acetylmuramoyl-pentapeptide-transferase [Phycisphaerales bacterium]